MAWEKGKTRPESSGRKKGTPNKRTEELMAICQEEGLDPFRALVRFAKGEPLEDIPIEKKIGIMLKQFDALKEVCQYLYPKRKALEHSGEINNPYMDLSVEELKELAKQRLNE